MDRQVLGRDEELGRLGAFVDRGALGPEGLVLDGEAGIGKTELWRHAVEAARERGYAVLEARPSQAERELAFAGLSDLLAGCGDELGALPPVSGGRSRWRCCWRTTAARRRTHGRSRPRR